MRAVRAAGLILSLMAFPAAAQQPLSPPAPEAVPEQPGSASSARTFAAPVGLLLNAVRPDRVADFETVLGYLEAALAMSTDATVRAQAQGWRVLKASEPGPNGTVLYVFVLDPVVPGADYGLGRILADAYPDQAQLQEIWKLYTGAVASGGSLLNLTPVQPPSPPADALLPVPRMLPPKK